MIIKMMDVGISILCCLGISILLYDAFWTSLIFIPIGVYIYMYLKNKREVKNKKRQTDEIKEWINSLASLISIGFSLESAVKESYTEMLTLYEVESFICKEINMLIRKINLNIPITKGILEMSLRNNIEELIEFANITDVAKKQGGNLKDIMEFTSDNIRERIQMEEEISSIIMSKEYEGKIMFLIPMFIIVFMRLTSKEIMINMYGNFIGIIIMSVCFLLYIGAFLWTKKIINTLK